MRHSFKAILENDGGSMDTAFISIPFDVEKTYGTKGQVKIKATFDGQLYRGVMARMGSGCHQVGVRKDIRAAIGKTIGDRIAVTIEKDDDERLIDMSFDLENILNKNAKAKSIFENLSFTNRKEYAVWISSAKKPETRERRLLQIVSKLLAGKRNPSEK